MQKIKAEDTNGLLNSLIQNALNGEQIVITMANKPILRLESCSSAPTEVKAKKRAFGSAKHMIARMAEDFDAPMDEFKDYM